MDLVFLGGNVMTMDRSGTRAEALAVKDGKIAAVGATARVSGMVSEDTVVVPLAGRTLIPGFVGPAQPFLSHGLRSGCGRLLDSASREHCRYQGGDCSGGGSCSTGSVDFRVGVRRELRAGGPEPDA